jgi:hypothetical protein
MFCAPKHSVMQCAALLPLVVVALATGIAADSARAQQVCGVAIDGMELTQAVQFYHDSEPDNSIPLVDGKPAALRVYVRLTPPGCNAPPGYRATGAASAAAGYYPFSAPVLVGAVLDGGIIPTSGHSERQQESSTLNVTFSTDLEHIPGWEPQIDAPLIFVVSVCTQLMPPQGGACSEYALANHTFSFKKGCGLDLKAIPVDVMNRGVPDDLAKLETYGDEFMWAAWPMPSPGNRARYTFADAPLIFEGDITDPESGARNALNQRLLDKKVGMSPEPDHLYGWIKGGCSGTGSDCRGWSSAGLNRRGAAWGTDDDAWYQRTYAHELVHHFTGPGHLTAFLRVVGWDVLDKAKAPNKLGRVKVPTGEYGYAALRQVGRPTVSSWTSENEHDYRYLRTLVASGECSDISSRLALPIIPRFIVRAARDSGTSNRCIRWRAARSPIPMVAQGI